jgi:hypothetical protein
MATAIFVPGPTVVNVSTGTSTTPGSFMVLGYSDNDNLPSIQFTDHLHEVKTVTSGAVPEELVAQNIEASVTVSLVKWDSDVLNTLLSDQRNAAYNNQVGRRLISSNGACGLQIRSVAAAQPGYTFTHAFLRPDSVGDSQWGNRERVLTLNFRCIPNPTDNLLCTYGNLPVTP